MIPATSDERDAVRPLTEGEMSEDDAAAGIGAPVPALFPEPAARAAADARLARLLDDALARAARGPVAPVLDFGTAARDMARFDFAAPQPLDDLVAFAIGQLEHGATHMTHPRYFGLYNPAPSHPAECADRIAAAFNPQLATATTSPGPVAMEAHVIRAVAERAGLPEGSTGHFTSGGSEANATALIAALTRANPAFAEHGVRALAGPPVCYVSRESHLAWLKIAHQAGIGRAAMRLVETDGRGRMSIAALETAIAADVARGAMPVMVAATAGTTNAGMVDPLPEICRLARQRGIWVHVDAAWAGGAIASPRLRPLLAGMDEACSVTIDAHKWLATTMGCGMFLTRHADVLPATFHVRASYMPSNSPSLDPYVTTALWSRRFLGLRLFLSLGAAGWPGYARHVERATELIARAADALARQGWRIANEPRLAVLCAIPPEGPQAVAGIVRRAVESGRAWVSAAELERTPVVRACATNGTTTEADVDALVHALDEAATAGRRSG